MIICKTFSDIPPTNGSLDSINVISNLIDYLSVFFFILQNDTKKHSYSNGIGIL